MTTSTPHAVRAPAPNFALLTVLLLVGTVVAAWWLTTLLPSSVDPADADYALAPLPLPGWAEAILGLVGLALVVVIGRALVRAVRAGTLSGARAAAAVLLVPVAGMAGIWWAIATAPVIGANIGVGLSLFAFVPLSLILVIVAVVVLVTAKRP